MAVTRTTIAHTISMRNELSRYVGEAELKLARMWEVAWREVSDEYALAVGELIDMGEGDWPTRSQILRAQRVENALKVTLDQMDALVPASATAMKENLSTILASAEHWSEQIAKTQLPPYGIATSWSRVDVGAMDAIVRRSTGRIHSLTRPLTRDMVSRMKQVLIRGVIVGDNPRAAARQIMRRTEQVFNGGRARALNIARTEMLDAHRAAATKARAANHDVIKGWRWHATLSARTCPSCLAQHGTFHKPDELGPLDHQQGRCTAVPVTKTWDELGVKGITEPADDFPNAREWFNAQPRDTKLSIMGAERLRRLEAGEIGWNDLSRRVVTPGWRDSYQIAPLSVKPPRNLFGDLKRKQNVNPDRFAAFEAIEDSVATNPLFRTSRAYQINCTSCATNFEMRRRGFDVEALPIPRLPSGEIPKTSGRYAKDYVTDKWTAPTGQGVTYTQVGNLTGIRTMMKDWPEGARGFVEVHWSKGGGHVFNVEKIDGEPKFYDAQVGTGDATGARDQLRRVKRGKVWLARMDNATPNRGILDYIKSKD